MQCLNCGKEIPDTAKACEFCEASVEPEPTAEEIQVAQQMLKQMGPEAREALWREVRRSRTAEEFADRIMVGECAKCGSENTSHCEHDPEINEILVGRCFDCGQLWCTECGRLLEEDRPVCSCWMEGK